MQKITLSQKDFTSCDLKTFGATHFVEEKGKVMIIYSPHISRPADFVFYDGNISTLEDRGLQRL